MTKCLNFTIREQKLSVGPKKGQKVFIARPTDRQRVTHRKFCDQSPKPPPLQEPKWKPCCAWQPKWLNAT